MIDNLAAGGMGQWLNGAVPLEREYKCEITTDQQPKHWQMLPVRMLKFVSLFRPLWLVVGFRYRVWLLLTDTSAGDLFIYF